MYYKNIIQTRGEVNLIVQKFVTTNSISDVGVTSDSVHVYHCQNPARRHEAISLTDIKYTI